MNATIIKMLEKIYRMRHKPDLHSFKAKTRDGIVYVEAEEEGIFVESITYDAEGKERRERWVRPIAVTAIELEVMGIDLTSVEN